MKLGSSPDMDTKRPRGSERSKPCHESQLTRRSQPPYPWPPEQAQPDVSKPCRTTAQNVWINDRNFNELGNERDPIIGAHDGSLEYKIPKRPIRKKIVGLPAFTTLRGGAYFFLPGLKALGYLASLNAQGRA